jgi:hypothetical protein
MLTAARLLRRIDQAVVGLAVDLGAAEDPDDDTDDDTADGPGGAGQAPSTASRAGVANTRSGS